jgi:carbon monoxide dehydrogenase subunit G
MEIIKDVQVNASLAEVWSFITEIEEVVSCFPGAEITKKISETEYEAAIKVKIGPFSTSFNCSTMIENMDNLKCSMTARAKGSDRKMGSNVSAVISIFLDEPSPEVTIIHTVTDFQLTGRLAQFGKGIFEGVSNRMMDTFGEKINERFK